MVNRSDKNYSRDKNKFNKEKKIKKVGTKPRSTEKQILSKYIDGKLSDDEYGDLLDYGEER